MIEIDKNLISDLFDQAAESPRLRQNFDLRTSSEEGCQRMLNALLPGTVVPVHRHPRSNESVLLVCGKIVEVVFDDAGNEVERCCLDTSVGNFGCVVPAGAWHTVEVLEPSVILEVKDGRYGEDGSEVFGQAPNAKAYGQSDAQSEEQLEGQADGQADEQADDGTESPSASFGNSLGDLRRNIEYLVGMERQSGSMEVITPLYVSRMLNVPLEEVERVMRDMDR